MDKIAELPEMEYAGEYIHTKKQLAMASEIVKDISWAESPHELSEHLEMPVTTVKSFLKKLRDQDVLTEKVVKEEGHEYVLVDPVTGAFYLKPSSLWSDFKRETKAFKRQGKFD